MFQGLLWHFMVQLTLVTHLFKIEEKQKEVDVNARETVHMRWHLEWELINQIVNQWRLTTRKVVELCGTGKSLKIYYLTVYKKSLMIGNISIAV
ncbi:hypothetical protein L2E82_51788 [Cichorium intybus]|nr:hypothetical protein L2E82_51788 [Cichorium intybus]